MTKLQSVERTLFDVSKKQKLIFDRFDLQFIKFTNIRDGRSDCNTRMFAVVRSFRNHTNNGEFRSNLIDTFCAIVSHPAPLLNLVMSRACRKLTPVLMGCSCIICRKGLYSEDSAYPPFPYLQIHRRRHHHRRH